MKLTPEQKEAMAAEKIVIEQCQAGNGEAFEQLYAKYHRGIYGFLLAMLKNPHAAEDITQDVFVKLFTQITSYRFQSPFAHWFFRLTRNAAIDHIRREKIRRAQSLDADSDSDFSLHERLAGKGKNPAENTEMGERAEIVRQAVLGLPETFKEVVILREWDDLPYEDIALHLGISEGTVKSRLFRARNILAKKLKGLL
jgi:RNA polymerase sigma-70 factor (ECF subfamily)